MSSPLEKEKSEVSIVDLANRKTPNESLKPRRTSRMTQSNSSPYLSSLAPAPQMTRATSQTTIMEDGTECDTATVEAIEQLREHIRQRSESFVEFSSESSSSLGPGKLRRASSISLKKSDLERLSFESEKQHKAIQEEPEAEAPKSPHEPAPEPPSFKLSTILSEEVMAVLTKSDRSDADITVLMRAFRGIKCIDKFTPYVRKEILRNGFHIRFSPGQILFKEGDMSENFYIVIEGVFGMIRPKHLQQAHGPLANMPNACAIQARLDKFSKDKSGAKGRIAGEDDVVNDYHTFFSAGDCFGEIGLLKNAPRAATVVCLEVADVLVIDKSQYESITKVLQEREVEQRTTFLHSLSMFQSWSRSSLMSLNSVLVHQTVLPTRVIIRQNDEPEGMFFIISGECNVVKEIVVNPPKLSGTSPERGKKEAQNTTLSYDGMKPLKEEKKLLHVGILVAGDYFGEIALLKGTRRTSTVVSASVVELLFLPKNEFSRRITHKPLEILKSQCDKYPNDDELRRTYHTQRKWGEYKQKIVSAVVSK